MIYRINGREVTREQFLAGAAKAKPSRMEKQRGRRFKPPGLFSDKTDWTFENGGKGRWCPQMGKKKDPKAYFHTRRKLIEHAKRDGYVVDHSD
jgi:hypothetical protein